MIEVEGAVGWWTMWLPRIIVSWKVDGPLGMVSDIILFFFRGRLNWWIPSLCDGNLGVGPMWWNSCVIWLSEVCWETSLVSLMLLLTRSSNEIRGLFKLCLIRAVYISESWNWEFFLPCRASEISILTFLDFRNLLRGLVSGVYPLIVYGLMSALTWSGTNAPTLIDYLTISLAAWGYPPMIFCPMPWPILPSVGRGDGIGDILDPFEKESNFGAGFSPFLFNFGCSSNFCVWSAPKL